MLNSAGQVMKRLMCIQHPTNTLRANKSLRRMMVMYSSPTTDSFFLFLAFSFCWGGGASPLAPVQYIVGGTLEKST